ncbi:outer membrane protein transport protein [Winogradskyella sp. 3972H.M.0a.05]|uniref:OmpP1/FadL family transporter n=1 Tax=Winogradskyella sp. 3972H.M.0a.05 TaxID=2950277 RepID=UPI00339B6D0F
MKKLAILFIVALAMPNLKAQDITDAVRYATDDVQGTARFRAMSGAFGALGGDMSAVSINPAGSAVFNSSHASLSLSSLNTSNDVRFFNGLTSSNDSKLDINQAGGAFVFKNYDESSKWRKFALSIAYDKTANYDNDWVASGINFNPNTETGNSIGNYFLEQAQGLRLDEISAFPGESITEAYADIGAVFGFANQQAFLGFESYILEPDADTDDNTSYTSNIADGEFNQRYSYIATGYNGKFSFNASTQYGENLYLGVNINTHFINYERATLLDETNNNTGSIVTDVRFENSLFTTGTGISFQLGAITKLNDVIRLGFTYNSPTWYRITEETAQFLATTRDDGGSIITEIINPNIISIFPEYRLKTPSKITGSLALVFGDQGLISFDYSRKDFGNTEFRPTSDTFFAAQNNIISDNLKVASSYRVGGEYRYKQLSFRGGYRLDESPYEDENFYGDLTGYSFGLGYNFGDFKLDLAVENSQREINERLYNVGLTDAATLDINNTDVTLSVAFNI